jgi:hypothetical protein
VLFVLRDHLESTVKCRRRLLLRIKEVEATVGGPPWATSPGPDGVRPGADMYQRGSGDL